jgi:phosphohistidine phosphatase
MKLYLVQHGQAQSKDEDPDRHLTESGREEVETMAAFLQPLNIKVKAIWHSGKPRAAQTAEILSSGVKAKLGVIHQDGLAPNDDVASVADEITQKKQDIFIVGHLPFLSRLASFLLCGDESVNVLRFQFSGVVCLELTEDTAWTLYWMVVPELL